MGARNATAGLVLGALAAAGCYGDPVGGPPYRAEIIDLVEIDPGTGEPEFALATREFSFLDDLESLSPELRVYRGGTLRIREIAGSVVQDGSFSDPGAPDLRYTSDGGVAVARDYPTLAMLSAYYQYERVLADLERVTGFTLDELADRVGQIQVFFEPAIEVEADTADQTVVQKFNAFYVPGNQQFGLAQRSELERVPLAVNRQVIAHEFGHALFEQTFQRNQREDCDPDREAQNASDPLFAGRFSVEYAISGINEGYADFISFAYTGGTNPVAALPVPSVDERDMERTEFSFSQLVMSDDACRGRFYCIGTLFAR